MCIRYCCAAGTRLSKALQAKLVAPLMSAAAAAAMPGLHAPGAYDSACVQLLHTVCGGSCNSTNGVQQTRGTAAAGSAPQWDSAKVAESLALACRLQPHVLRACRIAGPSCKLLLHGLILEGLAHGDLMCRQRAVHLLEVCVAEGCAPQVSVCATRQLCSPQALHCGLHTIHMCCMCWGLGRCNSVLTVDSVDTILLRVTVIVAGL